MITNREGPQGPSHGIEFTRVNHNEDCVMKAEEYLRLGWRTNLELVDCVHQMFFLYTKQVSKPNSAPDKYGDQFLTAGVITK